ncbi:MAG TPA: DUF2249 domain-containing protein [Azospirillum sp.]|nr:DUF2249 domain-containing protein [Azospirillum sp.]
MQTTLQPAGEAVIDVQAIPPYERHPLIFQAVQRLNPGQAFTLVNDHDPRPLYLQLQMHFGDGFDWEYLERGPEEWRVRISKPEGTADASSHFVRIERDGTAANAQPGAEPGPTADGALVVEVVECPPGTTSAQVLDLMRGVVPPPGMYRLPFERLVARRGGGCCGGMCG